MMMGFFAEGINVLSEALRSIAHVKVVAPDRNRSGASNSLTITAPVRLHHISEDVISVEGTPTDCVHLAMTGLFDSLPDMVITGINHGENVSDDVWYSGTVAAAMEGRFLGLPAIAISMAGDTPKHFKTAAKVAKMLVEHVQDRPLPPATFLNVNVPDVPWEDLQGFCITRLGQRHVAQPFIKQKDPRGGSIYWIGQPGDQADAGQGTDFHALHNKCVSITPLRVDLTHYDLCDILEDWVQDMNGLGDK